MRARQSRWGGWPLAVCVLVAGMIAPWMATTTAALATGAPTVATDHAFNTLPASTQLSVGLQEFGESGMAVGQSTRCYPKEGERAANSSKVRAGCILFSVIYPQVPLEFALYGTQEAIVYDGAKNGPFPTHLELQSETGELFSSEGLEGEGAVNAEDAIIAIGTKSTELITSECEDEGKLEGSCF